MERNLALELVRVTEAAALASARWMGKGEAGEADIAARDAVAIALRSVKMDARVVVGDIGPDVLAAASRAQSNDLPRVDVALDALQSTRAVALGRPNAISVIAASNRDSFLRPPLEYMHKVAVGPDAAGAIRMDATPLENLVNIADAKRCYVEDLAVCVLERDRNVELIDAVRATGARIQLIRDGDMAAAVATAIPGSGVDVLMGIGRSTSGLLSAAALRCVGGDMKARMWVRGDEDRRELERVEFGAPDRILTLDELVRGPNTVFAATGVTNSGVVNGVRFQPGGAVTHSIAMREKSGTLRVIEARHHFDRKPDYR